MQPIGAIAALSFTCKAFGPAPPVSSSWTYWARRALPVALVAAVAVTALLRI
ncbi:hypothetical protein ACFV16_31875 [Streptomyces massasporeus]|uniref:hypothetical protein n=1 Tax=Streptomyces massasporeus TaxID=67324 RepID=UPI0036CA0A5B